MSLPFGRSGQKTRPGLVINITHTTSGPAEADDFSNLWAKRCSRSRQETGLQGTLRQNID